MVQGVPVRIEIGPRDLAKDSCITCRRDRPGKAGKEFGIPISDGAELVLHVQSLLQDIQQSLLDNATEFRDAHIVDVATYDEFKANREFRLCKDVTL